MQRSTRFQIAVSRGPRVFVQCIPVSIRFLLTVLKDYAGNGSLWLDAR
jgi:hypothetical protein